MMFLRMAQVGGNSARAPSPYVTDVWRTTEGATRQLIVSVDPGRMRDPSALVILEKFVCDRQRVVTTKFNHIPAVIRSRQINRYAVVNAHRYPTGTTYPELVERVSQVMRQLPPRMERPRLILDATGVGRPVSDLFRQSGLQPFDVVLTGGNAAVRTDTGASVPKQDIVATLDAILSDGRLTITGQADASEVLRSELEDFQSGRTARGHETFAASGARHDDTVMALATGLWAAERNENVRLGTFGLWSR